MAKIFVYREPNKAGRAQHHSVYLLNTCVGELFDGGALEIPIEVGTHHLSFNSNLNAHGKNATIDVVVSEPDQIVRIKTRFDVNGEYLVECVGNESRAYTNTSAAQAQSQNGANSNSNPVIKPSALNCPLCGGKDLFPITETSTVGTDFNADDACCGYLLCGPIGLLLGVGSGKQTVTTTYWLCRGCGNKFKV